MLDYLKKVMKKEVLILPNKENDKFFFKLSESDGVEDKNKNPLYTFIFEKVPQNSVLIRLDERFLETRKIFISSSSEECKNKHDFEHFLCKKADYILIDDENKIIFIIEMKSTTSTEAHIVAQLKGGFCILKYFEAIINSFSNLFREKTSSRLPFDDFAYRYVSIKHIRTPTKRNRREPFKNYEDFSSAKKFLHLRGRKKIVYKMLLNGI